MGQAKQRGTFDERKAAAIAMGNIRKETLEEGVRNSTQWVCAVCGEREYIEVFTLRRISPIYTPGNVEAFFKDQQTISFRCLHCSTLAGRRQGEQENVPANNQPVEGRSSAGEDDRNANSNVSTP